MGIFSNLFGQTKNFDNGYLSQISQMNGKRTVLSIQINENQNFPSNIKRSKDKPIMMGNEIRNEILFFGILNAKPERIILTNPINHFEDVDGYDKSFEITLTIEKTGDGWAQYCTYKDLVQSSQNKFVLKGHTVYTI